jgi:hypothetical protein
MANGTLKVGTITTSSGSGNITIGSGVTLNSNTPAWFVNLSADQTGVTDNVATKVQLNTVEFDTDSLYDNSTNYRLTIPSGKAGKYQIEANVFVEHNASTLNRAIAYIYKNGSTFCSSFLDFRNNPIQKTNIVVSAVIDLAVGDYIEIFGFGDSTDSANVSFKGDSSARESWFQGYRIGA